jgi:SCY1-like protein 1
VPGPAIYRPPELATAGYEAIKRSPHTAVDSYGFAELIYEVFNSNFYGTDQLTQPKSIPPTMQSSYKRLITANPKSRISVSNFLDQGLRSGSFFDTPLIKLTDGVDNLGVKSAEERDEFLEYVSIPAIALMSCLTDSLQ